MTRWNNLKGYTKWDKLGGEREILHDFTAIWELKKQSKRQNQTKSGF